MMASATVDLPQPGFADDPLRLARHQLHVEVDDRRDFAGAGEVGNAQVAAFEHRDGTGCRILAVGEAADPFACR